MEEKLSSMLHKDWFIKKVANSLEINEDIVDKVIKHQFESVVNATQRNKRVEISGIGILIWKDSTAQRKLNIMDKYVRKIREKISNVDDDNLIREYTDKIDEVLLKRQVLINRINELHSDIRRLEKQSASRKRLRRADK
jgi:nucleoid DNA-binding protein